MINYRIVVDSCGEFTEDMKKNPHFAHAALHLSIDGEQFVDDETFDRLDFLAKMKESKLSEVQLSVTGSVQSGI